MLQLAIILFNMTKVDLLLKNAYVVTMNDSFQLFPEGAVAIRDGEIVSVGPSQDLEMDFQADEIVDCGGKALIPGLINAHTHAAMTLLRGLADDRRLDVWLLGYMMPVEREFVTPDFCRLENKLQFKDVFSHTIRCIEIGSHSNNFFKLVPLKYP